jgi:hypothetical protein
MMNLIWMKMTGRCNESDGATMAGGGMVERGRALHSL